MADAEAVYKLLLDDDPDTNAVIAKQLQANRELHQAVCALAAHHDQWPQALIDIALLDDSADFIAQFATCTDLEGGMCLLPLLDNPKRNDQEQSRIALNAIAQRSANLDSAFDIAHLLCSEYGFSGDRIDYYDPRNSYLPDVLQRRVGLPIVLTALWLIICRRRKIDAYAVAVPGHVYGACNGLYIDLYDGARLISDNELHLHFQGYPDEAILSFLEPATDRALLQRMARNLVNSYHRRGDNMRAAVALRLCASKPSDTDYPE